MQSRRRQSYSRQVAIGHLAFPTSQVDFKSPVKSYFAPVSCICLYDWLRVLGGYYRDGPGWSESAQSGSTNGPDW
jgi:hypothetical protein